MRRAVPGLILVLLLALGGAWWWRTRSDAFTGNPPAVAAARKDPVPTAKPSVTASLGPLRPDYDPEARKRLLGEAKAALLAKIARDYEEMNTDAAAKFSLQGAAFPGGFPAYLKQLALLERSKWDDYAKVLTPQELESLQLLEHHAGKLVNQTLANSAATEEQRLTVFRLQREFDDKYALSFDLTSASLLNREIERQALQEKVLAVLGPNLFAPWSRSEGVDYENLVQFARQSGIRPEAPLEVWRVKNEFIRRRLEINAQGGAPAEVQAAQAALVEQTRSRIVGLLGSGVLRDATTNGLNWLPTK